jgi:N-acetylglutamate synthase-like GNAT family acetyltransferase
MILEKGDELISVAAIRVHGAVLAEMPLIGTRFQYRRQGMCRRLLHAIEQMLQMVGVETLVLPAVPELLDTWTGAFGFKPMDTFPRQTLIELNLMAFPGTSLLHKSLPGLQAHPPIAGLCLL